jgi:hypothetical protein
MKAKLINYLQFTIIILIASGCLVQFCQVRKQRKRADDFEKLYLSCRDAPIYIDTTSDSIVVNGKLWIKPKEVKKFEIKFPLPEPDIIVKWDTVHDTLPPKFCEKYFADKYSVINGKDTGVIYYAIHTKDCEASIQFPRIRFPLKLITEKKTIDTCIDQEPVKIPVIKSHLWVYLMPQMVIKPFDVSSVTLGLIYIRKDKWGVGGGIGYDWRVNEPIAEVQGLIKLW